MIENEQVEEIFLILEDKLDKTIGVLQDEFAAVRAGRANPHILDKIQVEAYGGTSPKSLLKSIEKAILASNIGLTPTNDGNVIRLVFPELTEERRKDLVKQVKRMGEEAKIAVRNVRREAMESLKKMKNNKELSEDEGKACDQDVEKKIASAIEDVDKAVSAKEKELLTI